jgi:spermidine synthase
LNGPSRSLLLYLLFFISGFAFLVYALACAQLLSVSFSVLLSVLLAGLSAGSLIRHPPRWFATLLLAVALYAGATPFLVHSMFVGIVFFPAMVAGMLLSLLMEVSPPSIFSAYAAGAATGTVTAVFFFFPDFAIRHVIFVSAAVSASAGLIPFLLQWEVQVEEPASERSRLPLTLYFLLLLSGFAFLSNCILSTRALILVFGPSIYTSCAILFVILLGLAFGSFSYSKRVSANVDTYQLFSLIQFRLALSVVFFIGIFLRIPFVLRRTFQSVAFSFGTFLGLEFLAIFVLLFYASFFAGTIMPSALRFLRRKSVSIFYVCSTTGGVLACLALTYWLIPLIGLERSLRITALLNLLLGIYCFRKSAPAHQERHVLMIGAAVLALLLFLPAWNRNLLNAAYCAQKTPSFTGLPAIQQMNLLFYEEGSTAAVGVVEAKRIRTLVIDGKSDSSNAAQDLRIQVLTAHLPALVAGVFQKALILGLHNGVTSDALFMHHPVRIDCVEEEKQVAHAAQYFVEENRAILTRPNFQLTFQNHVAFLQKSREQYDLILMSTENPAMAPTLEVLLDAQNHLRRGGVFCESLALYPMSFADLGIFLRTFHAAFPHMGLWIDGNRLLIIGANQPVTIAYAAIGWQLQSPEVRQSFRMANITAQTFVRDYAGNERILSLLPHGLALHTQDHPLLAYSAPRSIFIDRSQEIADALRALAKRLQ